MALGLTRESNDLAHYLDGRLRGDCHAYPGGSGLMKDAAFGRIAGRSAALVSDAKDTGD